MRSAIASEGSTIHRGVFYGLEKIPLQRGVGILARVLDENVQVFQLHLDVQELFVQAFQLLYSRSSRLMLRTQVPGQDRETAVSPALAMSVIKR